MRVVLLKATPLWLVANATRMSHDTTDRSDSMAVSQDPTCPWCNTKMEACVVPEDWDKKVCVECGSIYSKDDHIGYADLKLIDKVGNKYKHESILEQASVVFEIDGLSRAALQELARHRTAKLTVKSTRYTLKKDLAKEAPFDHSEESRERARKYVVMTGNDELDRLLVSQLENLRQAVASGASNDLVKYLLPEAYKTKLQWQSDLRNFKHFLSLRLDKAALWEMRDLARAMYQALPRTYKVLLRDIYLEKGGEDA